MSLVKLYCNNNIYNYIKMGTIVSYDNKLYKLPLDYWDYYMVYIYNNQPHPLNVNKYIYSNIYSINNTIFSESFNEIINPRITLNIDIKNPSDLNSYINIIVENNDGTIKEEYTIYIDNINARSYNYNIISWNYFDNLKISLYTSFIGSIYLDIVGSIKQ